MREVVLRDFAAGHEHGRRDKRELAGMGRDVGGDARNQRRRGRREPVVDRNQESMLTTRFEAPDKLGEELTVGLPKATGEDDWEAERDRETRLEHGHSSSEYVTSSKAQSMMAGSSPASENMRPPCGCIIDTTYSAYKLVAFGGFFRG